MHKMRKRDLILMLGVGLIVLAGLLFWGIPRYQAIYRTPAVRLHGDLYLPETVTGTQKTYVSARNRLTFTAEEAGTQVTLDLFPYPAETYLIKEAGGLVQVDDARGTRRLDGRWQDGTLIDPATGLMDSRYWQQLSWSTPNAAKALDAYETEKSEIRGHGNLWIDFLYLFLIFNTAYLSLVFPRKSHQKIYEKFPIVRRIELVLIALLPFAGTAVILIRAVS